MFHKMMLLDSSFASSAAALLQLPGARNLRSIRWAKTPSRQVRRPGAMTGILPLFGIIEQRQTLYGEVVGGTAIDLFSAEFDAMVADPGIDRILILVDSPGGSVPGVQELSDKIFNARGRKEIISVVQGICASAGYWISSAASRMIIQPSGSTGSIGVRLEHQDWSKFMEERGIKTTLFQVPEFKAEFHPDFPLSEETIAYEQAEITRIYGDFVLDVARNRGTSVSNVRANYGKGRLVDARSAVRLGMADSIGTLDETLHGRSQEAASQREHSLRVAHQNRKEQTRLASNQPAPESKLDLQTRRLGDRLKSRGILRGQPSEKWFGPRYAAIWNRPTETKVDLGYATMFEAVSRGAFSETLASSAEVYLTIGHDHDNPLARRSDFSLHLSEDAVGLRVEFCLDNSIAGREAAAQLAAGKLRGMSWTPRNESMQHDYRDVRGTYCARLTRGDLLEVCLTDSPAYAATIRNR